MMTAEQKQIFDKRFPDASAYWLRCELQNEYHLLLKRNPEINTWESRRLEELSQLQFED
uniref:Uncharacterized protein n=1 Tax=viral metagenome TaxID=1070528 RepID=A0A6H1ZGW3_9ZZZZ